MPTVNARFDAQNVVLEGSNLIEASAGTGKTHSIAIMTLRLLLERQMPVGRILMVTFTNNAVSELELRIRSFIRQALNHCRGQAASDEGVKMVVDRCIGEAGREPVRELLEKAVVMLDDLSVMTIHSFCQKMLKEHSFETGQVFGAETLSPDEYSRISQEAFREYWRQQVTTLPVPMLDALLAVGLKMERVFEVVKQGLSGKIPAGVDTLSEDFLSEQWLRDYQRNREQKASEMDALEEEIIGIIQEGKAAYVASVEGNHHARNAFSEILRSEDWSAMVDTMIEKADKGYVQKIFTKALTQVLELGKLRGERLTDMKALVGMIAQGAYRSVLRAVEGSKDRSGQISFDDMIGKLRKALDPEGSELIAQIAGRFDAVFIDEFQDTDADQYAIFHRLFGEGKTLFYIGDPKQSIYGWRKADIFTYFEARNAVETIHEMNVNYRSTAAYIKAMNRLFLPTADFDTFHFSGAGNAIEYIPVNSPEVNTRGELLCDGRPVTDPLRISAHPVRPECWNALGAIMKEVLLSGRYSIRTGADTEAQPVNPNDIGILVRSNRDGRKAKEILSRLGIPSVTIDESRIFSGREAVEIYHVMLAVYEMTRAAINRALLTTIAGYDRKRILESDEDDILQRFRRYQETWKSEGVYVMLRQFLADHGIEGLYRDRNLGNPDRVLSNVLQLVETIHRVSERRNYDIPEQIQWLKKGIDGDSREADEYEQRIESDEQAVQIVTIHKSKGLEYRIVIAPNLDFKESSKVNNYSYRDPEDKRYYVFDKCQPLMDRQTAWAREQMEQENRRLFYVAVTRARYMCLITACDGTSYNTSTLRAFRTALAAIDTTADGIDRQWEIPAAGGPARYIPADGGTEVVYSAPRRFALTQQHWLRTSYSGLSPEHEPVLPPKPREGRLEEYDEFVFRSIRRGALSGNLIHHIFEHVDFSDDSGWHHAVERAVRRLSSPKDPSFHEGLKRLVGHVTRARIPAGGDLTLSTVGKSDRLSELEFDFPLGFFNTNEILNLSTVQAPFRVDDDRNIEGIMNGKIDLVFRHGGRYYILDWKSNYLGDSVDDYGPERLARAMEDNNYHLQYHIYTVALRRFLASRNPDFDYARDFGGVFYLFVRGMREEGSQGVFHVLPDIRVVDALDRMAAGNRPLAV